VADRIFDGERILTGCNVLIHGERSSTWYREARFQRTAPLLISAPAQCSLPVSLMFRSMGWRRVTERRADLAGINTIVAAHRRFGTTGLLPTLITDRREVTERLAGIAESALEIPGVLGFHLEGPFINPTRKVSIRASESDRRDRGHGAAAPVRQLRPFDCHSRARMRA